MSDFPYMNFFIGDYMRDTWTLDTVEHGAYCLLIFNYWNNGGPLPDNDKELAKMTRLGVKKWKKVSAKVKPFFQIREGQLFHKRVEEELQKVRERSEKARESANARWCGRNANADANASPKHMLQPCYSDSEPYKEPLTPQAGNPGEEEKPVPKNSRAHGTNPRALGTSPRTNVIRQEEEAREDHRIQRQVDDAWAEANAAPADEALDAIEKMRVLAGKSSADVVATNPSEPDVPVGAVVLEEDDIPW